MRRSDRSQLLDDLVAAIERIHVPHPTRVCLDGSPAAGKTTLGDEVADRLRHEGRPVVRATVDDFLHPRAIRYRRGEFSALGCFHDAHDHAALTRVLLDPLGPGGNRRVHTAVYDHTHDAVISPPAQLVPDDAVALVDGVFLLRPELIDRWELRVFVTASPEQAIARAVVRDGQPAAVIERRWRGRYLPAQRLYAEAVHPAERADVLVDNDDPARPGWIIRPRRTDP